MFTLKVTDFLVEYDLAITWLKSIGLKIEESCRFLFYRNNIHKFITTIILKSEQASEAEIAEIKKHLANSFLEAEELVFIYRAFKNSLPPASKRKMGEILQGPSQYLHEDDNSNHARNIAFELYIAAKMKNADFTPFPGAEADVLFEAEGLSFLVECKRPMRYKTVVKNVRKANSQLGMRFDSSGDKKGLIALSLTRMANPDLQVLSFVSQESMIRKLDALWANFKSHFGEHLREGVDRRVLGWMGVIRVPFILNGQVSDISVCNQSYFVNITHQSEPENDAMNRILAKVANSFNVNSI